MICCLFLFLEWRWVSIVGSIHYQVFFPYLFTKKVLGHVLQFLNFFFKKKILEKTFFISFKIEKLKKNLKDVISLHLIAIQLIDSSRTSELNKVKSLKTKLNEIEF